MALRLPMRYNAAGIEHIRIELNQAISLCDAAQAGDLTKAEKSVAEASAVYSRVLKLIPRVHLNSHESCEIDDKKLELASLLRLSTERIHCRRQDSIVRNGDGDGLFEPELSAVTPLV